MICVVAGSGREKDEKRFRIRRDILEDFPLNHAPFGRRELVKDKAAKRCGASLISSRLSNKILQEENSLVLCVWLGFTITN